MKVIGRVTTFVLVLLASVILEASSSEILVSPDTPLPEDNTESRLLVAALSGLLDDAQGNVEVSDWVLQSERSQTNLLLDELRELNAEWDGTEVLSPSLSDVTPVGDGSYIVELSYADTRTQTPVLIAQFDLVARRIADSFLFSSPLRWNTKRWSTLADGHLTFHYQADNDRLFEQYASIIREYDSMLGIARPTELYFCSDCDSLLQLLQLVGIRYHRDYDGLSWKMIDFHTPEKTFNLYSSKYSNKDSADAHDIFHARANLAIPADQRNRLMICGCAYVMAGSRGYSWDEIQDIFRANMALDKNEDWLELYFERHNFGVEAERSLFVTQFVNALIIQKVEEEQGFSFVMRLLASGNMYEDREGFFRTLEAVAGIDEASFNEKVGKMVIDALEK